MNHHIKNQSSKKHSPLKHVIHMVLCCGLPILILLSLPWVSQFSPALSVFLGFVAPFICPLMMGGMMFAMLRENHKKHSCCSAEDPIETTQSIESQ